jgi:hypothetical protein
VLSCEQAHWNRGPTRLCMQMQGEASSQKRVVQRRGIGHGGTPPLSFPAWFLDPKLPPPASSTSEQRAEHAGRQEPLADTVTPGSQCTGSQYATSGATLSWNRTSSPAASTPARSNTPNARSNPRSNARVSHSRTASDVQMSATHTACAWARGRAVPYLQDFMLLEDRMPSLNACLATSTTWNSAVVCLPAVRRSSLHDGHATPTKV